MEIGPLQLVVIGFENDDNFHGQIRRELDALQGRGVIRLLDALFVHKDDNGRLEVTRRPGADAEELATYGTALRRLLAGIVDETPASDITEGAMALTPADLRRIFDSLQPGTAVGLVLFEHTWAVSLSEAVRSASGRMLGQGMVTKKLQTMMGKELQAIAEAEAAIEQADAIRAAALLDATAFAAEAEMVGDLVSSSIAAETLRALLVSGFIDDGKAGKAFEELMRAGLIDAQAVQNAMAAAGQIEAEVQMVAAAQAAPR